MADHDDAQFGFKKPSSAREKLLNIKPTVPPPLPDNMEQLDRIADNAGFVSREVARTQPYEAVRIPVTQAAEPRVPLSMRIPVPVGNAFKRFCDEERYSYPEALEEIMRRAGLPTK